VMMTLAPRLARMGCPEKSLVAVREIKDARDRAKIIADLGPYLPDELLQDALILAQELDDDYARLQALQGLAPYLPSSLLHQSLALVREFDDGWYRVQLLASLAPRLSQTLLHEAISISREISDLKERANALVILACHLPVPEQKIKNNWLRWVPTRPSSLVLLEDALKTACKITDKLDRVSALIELAAHLHQNEQKFSSRGWHIRKQISRDVLAAVRDRSIGHYTEENLCGSVARLAPHLPKDLILDAVSIMQGCRDPFYRADSLIVLVPYLSQEEREKVLHKELVILHKELAESSLFRKMYYNSMAYELQVLAPHLSQKLLYEAFALASKFFDREKHAVILAALAFYLPKEEQVEVFSNAILLAQEVEDKATRSDIFYTLSQRLAELGSVDLALSTIRQISDADNRASVLAILAPHLPDDLFQVVLADELSSESEFYRAKVLAQLAPHLPERFLPKALTIARKIDDANLRKDALVALAPQLAAWSNRDRHLSYKVNQETLRSLAVYSRPRFLVDLCALSPWFAALGGDVTIDDTFISIQDVVRWWP